MCQIQKGSPAEKRGGKTEKEELGVFETLKKKRSERKKEGQKKKKNSVIAQMPSEGGEEAQGKKKKKPGVIPEEGRPETHKRNHKVFVGGAGGGDRGL